jgi:hypothetical protein
MDVVTTDVSDARDHRGKGSGIGKAGAHSIHVGTIGHDRAGATTLQEPDDAVAADAGRHVETKGAKAVSDDCRRASFLAGWLRMSVKIVSQLDELRANGLEAVF